MKQPIYAGVDVGGTNTKVGIVGENGDVVATTKFPTQPKMQPAVCLGNAADCIKQLLSDAGMEYNDLMSVGLATPGPMDIPNGMVLTPFNLPGWRHTNVQKTLADLTQRRVAFSNDAGAAAFGEYWVGSGRRFDSIILITLGTGVGGGIIINDFALDGAHSHGAEIGHMIVDPTENARTCACGGKGHLEAYASATALVARCKEALASGTQSLLSSDETITALEIYQAAQKGDALANSLITETANFLGDGIASLLHTVDPQAILLGGAMNFGGSESEIGRAFVEQICARAKPNCLPLLAEKMTVQYAKLGSDAGFIGAAGLARQLHLTKSISPTV